VSVEGLMRAEAVTKQADVIAAITLEVLKGTTKAFDAGISDFNCHRANLISNDFEVFYSSAMEEKLQSGNLGGRPFGGTAIFSRKKLPAGCPWLIPLILALQQSAYITCILVILIC